jgi:hypothetical protein
MGSCESMSYATRAGIGFVICAPLPPSSVRRLTHAYMQSSCSSRSSPRSPCAAAAAFSRRSRHSSASPPRASPCTRPRGARGASTCGGPAAPPQAHYAGVYAPGYMAPVSSFESGCGGRKLMGSSRAGRRRRRRSSTRRRRSTSSPSTRHRRARRPPTGRRTWSERVGRWGRQILYVY